MKCKRCSLPAQVALPSHHTAFCPQCFFTFFERQVQKAIRKQKMFAPADNILVALSGGKDSLALIWQLKKLGYNVAGLHIDLGILNSSEYARQSTEAFCQKFEIELHILETTAYDLNITEVKKRIRRPICSVCGQIKRYFFNRFALENGYNVLATGHNMDDEVARLFANTLSWDSAHLSGQGPVLEAGSGFVRKVKPLYLVSEYETAALCFLAGINYGYHPCPYSSGASFTFYKGLIEQLEEKQPGRKRSFYDGFLKKGRPGFQQIAPEQEDMVAPCKECGMPSSLEICGVCRVRARMQGED